MLSARRSLIRYFLIDRRAARELLSTLLGYESEIHSRIAILLVDSLDYSIWHMWYGVTRVSASAAVS